MFDRAPAQDAVGAAELGQTRWLHLVAPEVGTIAVLERELAIPSTLVRHVLDQDELARLEKTMGALLVVVRVPQAVGEGEATRYTTVPFSIILTQQAIVTICSTETVVVPATSELYAVEGVDKQRSRFVLLVLQKNSRSLSPLSARDRNTGRWYRRAPSTLAA